MKVRELAQKLLTCDPDAEVQLTECYDEPDSYVITGATITHRGDITLEIARIDEAEYPA